VGGRYDGYERSLESAEANILEGEGALKRRNRSLGSMAAEAWQQGAVTQKRKDQLKQGLRTVPPPSLAPSHFHLHRDINFWRTKGGQISLAFSSDKPRRTAPKRIEWCGN